jgi:hypothetical protein
MPASSFNQPIGSVEQRGQEDEAEAPLAVLRLIQRGLSNIGILHSNYRPLAIALHEHLDHDAIPRLPRGAVWILVSSHSPANVGNGDVWSNELDLGICDRPYALLKTASHAFGFVAAGTLHGFLAPAPPRLRSAHRPRPGRSMPERRAGSRHHPNASGFPLSQLHPRPDPRRLGRGIGQ